MLLQTKLLILGVLRRGPYIAYRNIFSITCVHSPLCRVYSSFFEKAYAPVAILAPSDHQTVTSVSLSTSAVDEFTGFIPVVNSKVEVRFHVQSAKWLSTPIKIKLLEREAGRITKDGYLVITSEKTRRQLLNQADCIDRLRTMIYNAVDDKPYEPTKEELALWKRRKDSAKARVLQDKRQKSQIKTYRRTSSDDGPY